MLAWAVSAFFPQAHSASRREAIRRDAEQRLRTGYTLIGIITMGMPWV
ncbi:MAG TPA: hypothetical protein VGK71_01985 [Nitrospirota bacterium]